VQNRPPYTADQTKAPFFEGLLAYRDAGIVPYSTPGHKQGRGASAEMIEAFGLDALCLDIPNGGGVDDTHRTWGMQRKAELLAADAWQAEDAIFLVNGSSTGNIAFMLAMCRPGDKILVGRNLHTSLLSGLILSGARPIYLYPAVHPTFNLTLDIDPASVQAALDQHPDTRAVALISPSYTGVSSNLPEISRICRERSVPLFVDEAWGPHFPFHDTLPPAAVQAGASVGVTSIHKLLAGLTQSSLLTLGGPFVAREDLVPAISLIETTSPSAMIAASIDVARRQMAIHGHALLERTIDLAMSVRKRLREVSGVRVIDESVIHDRSGAGFDPTRIMVDVQGLGITGFEAEAYLRTEARIGVEMSDLSGFIVHITIGDNQETADHLVRGIDALANRTPPGNPARLDEALRSSGSAIFSAVPELTPREAALGKTRAIPLGEAVGEIAAEIITPYPPGIPVAAPGDRFTPECIEYLNAARDAGMYISGSRDPALLTVQIVASEA
jgi:arginine/lysine/ornithine decarboxylase